MSDTDNLAPWPRFLSLPEMRYQNAYVWLVLASVLDVLLTYLVLYVWRGNEANPVASAIIGQMGFAWTVVFKLAICLLVVVICEVVGRLRDRAGRRLAIAAVIINAFPVAYTFALIRTSGPTPEAEEVGTGVLTLCRALGYFA